LGYLAPEAGVLIQGGGKRLRARCPQPLVEVPNIKFEVFIEITHPMSARYSESKAKICLSENNLGFFFSLKKIGCGDFFGSGP
jgi:hypothetical protein